ncbi:gene 10 protein [Roseibium sp. TrichSKD4]|uniref:peptidoglycan-binding protein n=1 Tax=Roseibium sp. TrichSKD4 TaxID=744980 RepID=UPI0001E56D5E|nr:peptidoglycan-binding protein [Roseibium sp. TrichSKD4]EFO32144.1 gene 10 protein [Roseibium sp. TrichSKD4]
MLTTAQLERIEGKRFTKKQEANARSVLMALDVYGDHVGLEVPHRLAQYLAQISHESGGYHHDREIWGPTPAQKRYDTRTDLGNTPECDGDGLKYRGHTAIQITGKANTRQYRDWCRAKIDPNAPDFVADPELMNTDPWEGLGPLWYWDTRKLNRFADRGDIKTITKRINGGYNGFKDRKRRYVRTALVLLDFDPTNIKGFQEASALLVDGIAGPKTLAALHRALVKLTDFTKDLGREPINQKPATKSRGIGGSSIAGAGGAVVLVEPVQKCIAVIEGQKAALSSGDITTLVVGGIVVAGALLALYARLDDGGYIDRWTGRG